MSFRRLLVSLAAASAAALWCSTAHAADDEPDKPVEDGFVGLWDVVVTPDDASKRAGAMQFSDRLLFEGEQFTAEACTMLYGFNPTSYQIVQVEGVSTYTVTLVNVGLGQMVWSGHKSATGQLQGALQWNRSDGRVFNYSVQGAWTPVP